MKVFILSLVMVCLLGCEKVTGSFDCGVVISVQTASQDGGLFLGTTEAVVDCERAVVKFYTLPPVAKGMRLNVYESNYGYFLFLGGKKYGVYLVKKSGITSDTIHGTYTPQWGYKRDK